MKYEHIQKKLFCFSLFIYYFTYIWFIEAKTGDIFGNFGFATKNFCVILAYIVLSFKVVVGGIHKRKIPLKAIIIFCMGMISYNQTESMFLLPIFIFLACSEDVNIDSIINTVYYAVLASVPICVVLSLVGIFPNEMVNKYAMEGFCYSLSFYHPNTAGTLLFEFCMLYIYHHRRKITYAKCAFIMFVGVMTFMLTKSRSSSFLMIAVAFVCIYRLVFKKVNTKEYPKYFGKMLTTILVATVAACVYIAVTPGFENETTFLTGRISQIAVYYAYYGLKVWGQPLAAYGGTDVEKLMETNLYTLDTAYAYLLIGFGVIIFIIFIYLLIRQIQYEVLVNDFYVLLILAAYVVIGISETSLIRWVYNPMLLLFSTQIWGKDSRIMHMKRVRLVWGLKR